MEVVQYTFQLTHRDSPVVIFHCDAPLCILLILAVRSTAYLGTCTLSLEFSCSVSPTQVSPSL